ncbi:MAG: hypothetical protein HQK65_19560 [Desulfamplus sp.]|nr:hypothetical protein [Desulfamplus sp.]
MKNRLLISTIIALGLLTGCEEKTPKEVDTKVEQEAEMSIKQVTREDVEVVVIDGCEYIIYKETNGNNQGYGFMAHKGNCKNPIHKHNEVDSTNAKKQE